MARTDPALSRLTDAERAQLEQWAGAGDLYWVQLTGTRLDVGEWFRQGRVWLGCLPDRLGLFAAGRCPYAEVIPFHELQSSLYNAVTGELVLAPARTARVRRLKLKPLEACQALSQIYSEEISYAGKPD